MSQVVTQPTASPATTEVVRIEPFTSELRAVGNLRDHPGRLAVVVRERGSGDLLLIIDAVSAFDDARRLAIETARGRGARVSLGDRRSLIQASMSPITLPQAAPPQPLTSADPIEVRLHDVRIQVIRQGAAETVWRAFGGERLLLAGTVDGVESLCATLARAAAMAASSPLLTDELEMVRRLQQLATWSLV